ncbi:MAG: hypothetical protein JW763_09465 [candidate division Zixibacteria bacterium]|nr:hypothetical protein [candidate division Zixibacteria bacterium]
MRKILIAILGVYILVLSLAWVIQTDTANAVPAFARKYNMSCTTCHAPFPRLKAYGDEFAGNGFVLKDQDAPRYFVGTGDEHLDLIRDFPIAARFEGFIKHETVTDREADFTSPYNLKLISGGALTKDIAYYFYFFLSERGEVAGIEDAYIMFNNLFNSELDVYLGQFQVSDPLFKREVRLSYEDYLIYKTKVGESGVNLAYDRGAMLTYGFPGGTDIIVEILNGNGIGEADDFRVYDNDKYKNFAGRISQDIGDYLRIGGFGYFGKEKSDYTNEIWMAGGDMTAGNDKVELNVQYLERRDDNPEFAEVKPSEVETRGGLAELIVMPDGERSRWYAVALYNKVDSDIDDNDYESITAHVGHVLRTNIRLILEDTYDIENEENRAVVGFVVGF